MTKEEYKEKVFEILDEFLRDYEEISLEEIEGVVNKIMAIPTPREGNPYVGMATRKDGTFRLGRGKQSNS